MTGKKPSLTFNNLAGTTPPFLSLGPTVKSFYKEDLVSTKSTLINANSFENGTGGNNNVDNDGQIVYKSKQHIVTGLSFNQTQTCISGCLNGYKDLIQNKTICDNNSKHGFVIYDARSGRQIWINEQFKVKVIMVRMIFRTNFFLFVVELPHNGLQRIFFYDDHTNKKIADFAFPNKVIKNILATKDRLIIVTEQQILIRKIAFEYSAAGEFKTFRETQNEESIETGKNVYGACGVSYDKTNFILACPAARDGDILLFWSSDKKTTTTIKGAHFSTLRILSMNFEGTRLASVSEKGTVIRVYDTSTPSAGTNANSSKCILEFRRGLEPTIVTSLTFDLKSEWLALSSSHGTIHVFSLLPEKQNTDFSFNLAGIHKYVLSMARVTTQIVSLRAFSKYTITEGKNPIVCFQDQSESETETADKNTIRMSILTEEGFHSQISFNRNCPGQESKLIKHTTMQEIFMF